MASYGFSAQQHHGGICPSDLSLGRASMITIEIGETTGPSISRRGRYGMTNQRFNRKTAIALIITFYRNMSAIVGFCQGPTALPKIKNPTIRTKEKVLSRAGN